MPKAAKQTMRARTLPQSRKGKMIPPPARSRELSDLPEWVCRSALPIARAALSQSSKRTMECAGGPYMKDFARELKDATRVLRRCAGMTEKAQARLSAAIAAAAK